jgi:cysteine-rich repeat protein
MRRLAVLLAALLALGACSDDGARGGAGAASGVGGETAQTSSTSGSGGGVVLPTCGDGDLDPGEACDDGNTSDFDGCKTNCRVVEPIAAPPLEWTYVEVPGTLCMDGSTAGFGVSINPASPNVMIYLEGGGACFNDACDFSAFSIPFIPPPDGIFNRSNTANPVKDWSMVYVPYCSGDIHGGNKDTVLGGKTRHFRGYTNITKYLELWGATFRDPDTVLVTGISAGGFGAGLNFPQIADAFGPGPQMVMIDDSGPPLSNMVIAPCLEQTFREVWGLDQTVLAACGADCPDENDFASGFIDHVVKTYPTARLGVFSNTADTVIRTFMGFGWCDGVRDDCSGVPTNVPADTYEEGLLALRAKYASRAGSYLIGQTRAGYAFGTGHTVLRSPTFWTTVIDGTSVADWVGGVIAGDVEQVGP